MHDCDRQYRAVCFDLDGTLLPMDIDEFMKSYFARIAAYAGGCGLDPERFLDALKLGVHAMAHNEDGRTNMKAFWEVFPDAYGKEDLEGLDILDICNRFYAEDFGHIGDGFEGNPAAARAVETLDRKGYPLVLTTMPMFPLPAVKHRLRWAGVDPSRFKRITTYENSSSTKPRLSYYSENLDAMGLRGEDVLMVGNNTVEDLAFMELGADAFLVTDWLLDPAGIDLDTVRHGSLEQFADWTETLPDCKNPARDINP